MNVDRDILLNSQGQNPNFFNIKLPENLAIHPNSEVAITQGRVHQSLGINIDNTNNTFVIMYGMYNLPNTGSATPLMFLKPEKFKLKSGKWNLRSSNQNSAGNSLPTFFGFGDQNILTNIVDTINENTQYWIWQWGGKFTSSTAYNIFPFICNHTSGAVTWKPSLLRDNIDPAEQMGLVFNAETAAAPSSTTITEANDQTNGFIVSTETVPLPYSFDMKAATATNPQSYVSLKIPAAADIIIRLFGGLCTKEQEDYKINQDYNPEKDWVRAPMVDGEPDLDLTTALENQLIFSYEVSNAGVITFTRRFVNPDGSAGAVANSTISTVAFDFATETTIEIKPQIMIDAGETIIRVLGIATITGGATQTIVMGHLTPAETCFEYKHAMCYVGDQTLNFVGIDKSRFTFNRSDLTLGTIEKGNYAGAPRLGSINGALVTKPILENEVMVITPDTTCNIEFAEFTRDCNADFMTKVDKNYYYLNGGTLSSIAALAITNNVGLAELPEFHINIENLPLANMSGNSQFGNIVKRVYSHYSEDDDLAEVINPHNIRYHKLHNKGVQNLDVIRVRFTDSEGRTYEGLNNTTLLNLHIRTNPHRMFQNLIGTASGQEQKLDTFGSTQDNIERNNDLSNSVI